ncbi:uncharacterized protein LOC127250729 isoform X1 [Andrographis paniculata]|uniref:uncharacterized protein LOC127250729 isoform X1 n=1 Tax=Andrographis paniculata TaxID=175694 RepID=UPI0021E842C7|nr:uncharacterized protein LOC127250729 isoform X1 [Andrographis paniculata]
MEFAVSCIKFTGDYWLFVVALVATLLCVLIPTVLSSLKGRSRRRSAVELEVSGVCDCDFDRDCAVGGSGIGCGGGEMTAVVSGVGANENGGDMVVERQTGASMMEQLVPEITTHALSYLDYPSLCRLSMTNSLMRKAANDDNAWKALYHKDFTLEQDNVIPTNGWKAYYAATRAVVNANAEFFRIVKERSLQAMGQFWLNADYVKCFHATGESFSGYGELAIGIQLGERGGLPDTRCEDARADGHGVGDDESLHRRGQQAIQRDECVRTAQRPVAHGAPPQLGRHHSRRGRVNSNSTTPRQPQLHIADIHFTASESISK